MLKSVLLTLAVIPQIQSFLQPSSFHPVGTFIGNRQLLKTNKPIAPLMYANNTDDFSEQQGGLSIDDATASVGKMEMLLNDEDFSQEYIKQIIHTASYTLLPDLNDNLANVRINQIRHLLAHVMAQEELNYGASYFATYVAVRYYDQVAAPLGASLLLQARLLSSLKFKSDKGMQLPNIAELVLPQFIKDNLWFESLKTSEFPLRLEENLQAKLVASKRQIPIGIAHDLVESYRNLSARLKNSYMVDRGDLDDDYNKLQWILAQCLVLYHLSYNNADFAEFWLELYQSFKITENLSEQVGDFHDYLISWIGISYYGEEQFFQRLHDEASGYRRRHDFYANAFCKVLNWHRSIDVNKEN